MQHTPTYIKQKFITSLNDNHKLITGLLSGNLSRKIYESLIEHSFLKVYIEWETFLEDSFKSFLLGRKTNSGYKVERFVKPRDSKHANDLIASKWTNRYEIWNSIEVGKRADLFFKKSNYQNAFLSIKTQLDEMSKIRNHIAHNSKITKQEFEQVVRNRLQGGTVPQNISVGKFLLNVNPILHKSIYDWYIDSLLGASGLIVP